MKTPVWKKILLVIALWACALVGGALLVGLFQLVAYNKLPEWLIMAISGGVGVLAGVGVMENGTGAEDHTFRLVNYVVLASVLCVMTALYIYTAQPVLRTIQAGVAAALAIGSAASETQKEKKT